MERVCVKCGGPIEKRRGRPSPTCSGCKERLGEKQYRVKCPRCGKIRTLRQRCRTFSTACQSCAAKDKIERKRTALAEARLAHPCPVCGKPAAVHYGRVMKTCGDRYCLDQRRRLQKYGIQSRAQLVEMFDRQQGCCAACGRPGTLDPLPEQRHGQKVLWAVGRAHSLLPLVIDHHHGTGIVRELLCNACNVAYGMLADDRARIEGLLAYHDRHHRLTEILS